MIGRHLSKSVFCSLSILMCSSLYGADLGESAYDADILNTKQLGHVRHIIDSARQLPGDWRYMEPRTPLSFDAYQFQLAFMSYALAVVQMNYTPAYKELYKDAQLRLIEKIVRRDVWAPTWVEVVEMPYYSKYLEAGKEWRDPVREKNIMYSGHLLQMIGLYEVLYHDLRFDKPDSIVFELPGLDGFKNTYNHHSLAQLITDQFVESDHVGVECEPNVVYAECNQHPILGLIHYDWIHESMLSNVRQAFWDKAEELNYISPQTSRTMYYYRVKEQEVVEKPLAWSDGWNGLMMHAWNADLVRRNYPAQRDAEKAALMDTRPEHWSRRWSTPYASYDFGFLAAYAAEVDDRETVSAMLDYADRHFKPQWADGRYFYPRRDVTEATFGADTEKDWIVPKEKYGQHEMTLLIANGVLPLARLNPGNGLRRLYDRDSMKKRLNGDTPEIVKVKYPEVLISHAVYNREHNRLSVRIKPGTGYRGMSDIGIINLDTGTRYSVMLDGKEVFQLHQGKVVSRESGKVEGAWDAGDSTLTISLPIDDAQALDIVSVHELDTVSAM